MNWRIETDIIILILLLILFIFIKMFDRSTVFKNKMFNLLLVATMAAIISDVIVNITMNSLTISWWIYQLSLVIYYVFQPAVSYIFFLFCLSIVYIKLTRKIRTVLIITAIPILINTIITLFNPLTNMIFNIDYQTNVFSFGTFFWLPIVIFVFYVGAILCLCIYHKNYFSLVSSFYLVIITTLVSAIAFAFQLIMTNDSDIVLLNISPVYVICIYIYYLFVRVRTLTYDTNTYLLNSYTGEKQMKEYIAYNRDNSSYGLAILAIRDYSYLCQKLGYAFGNDILARVANVLKEVLPNECVISIKENGQFVVLFTLGENSDEIKDIYDLLVKTVAEKILFVGTDIKIMLVCGVSFYPTQSYNYYELYEKANKALEKAYKKESDLINFYEE